MAVKSKKIWNWAIFKYTLISYIGIMIIPLFGVVILYNRAAKTVEEQCRLAAMTALENFSSTIDMNLTDMDKEIALLTTDSILSNTAELYPPNSKGFNAAEALKSVSYMNRFRKRYPFNGALYLLFHQNQAILSNSFILFDYQFFYESHLKTDLSLSYQDWENAVQNTSPVGRFLSYNSNADNIVYYKSFSSSNRHDGIVLFSFDKNQLLDPIRPFAEANRAYLFLSGGDDRLITGLTPDGSLLPDTFPASTFQTGRLDYGGHEMLMVSAVSPYNQLQYHLLLPVDVVLQQVQNIRLWFLILTMISAVCGILLAFYLSYRTSRPMIDFTSAIPASTDRTRIKTPSKFFDSLKGSVTNLMEQNTALSLAQQRQRELLHTIYVDKLFQGGLPCSDAAFAQIESLDIHLAGKGFIAAEISIGEYDDALGPEAYTDYAIIRENIENTLYRIFQHDAYMKILGESLMGVLVCLEQEQFQTAAASIEEAAKKTNAVISHLHKINCYWGIGRFCDDITMIAKSYGEARQALQYCQGTEDIGYICKFIDIPKVNSSFYYPLDVELFIVNCVKSGNVPALNQSLDTILSRNQGKTERGKALLLGEMQHSVYKLISELPEEEGEAVAAVLEQDCGASDSCPFDTRFHLVSGLFRELAVRQRDKKLNRNQEQIERMKEYVQEHYHDANLSVKSMAEAFNMSESYFSQYFKEFSGDTFSFYVETARINAACNMLDHPQKGHRKAESIENISNLVGYSNIRTFRRAFKKRLGVPPAEYKR